MSPARDGGVTRPETGIPCYPRARNGARPAAIHRDGASLRHRPGLKVPRAFR